MAVVKIIGAGLAGSEAAYQLASRGIDVELYEMRPKKNTPAHHTSEFAELVCSNSLKSLDQTSAAGTLKFELMQMDSFVLRKAFECRVPAGKALAVNREKFSESVTKELEANPHVVIVRDEVTQIPEPPAIIATGPLTSGPLADSIHNLLGGEFMSFYDAAAPIVEAESLDMDKIFIQSRYDKGGADYLNAPFNKEEYENFVQELVDAERVILKEFESKDLFSACQPVEEIARTGLDALRYGPLKPIGLRDPKTGHRPWAAVQLRAENEDKSAYNLVGFQTNLRFPEQERVFRMIPGLENANFSRFGVMHRNTFIDSPHALGPTFNSKDGKSIRFAGQLTGTEGYCEAIASGLYAALATYADLIGTSLPKPPVYTMFGSLVDYATNPNTLKYQPMHVNYGIMAPFEHRIRNKSERYRAYSERARNSLIDYRSKLYELGIVPFANSEFTLDEDTGLPIRTRVGS